MAKQKITSWEDWLGETVYYDQNGKKIGSSHPGFFGNTELYDTVGHCVGTSREGFFGSTITSTIK